jgi:hypothetical protein
MRSLYRRVLPGVLALTSAVAAASGCSSDIEPNGADMPRGRFASAYAQALCTSLAHCCSENAVPFTFGGCTTTARAVAEARLADPIQGGNYDGRLASQCVQAVSAAESVSCDPVPGSISDARTVCQKVFEGRKAIGESCKSSAECKPVEGQIVGCEGLPLTDPDAGLLPLSIPRLLEGSDLRPLDAPRSTPQCVSFPPMEPGARCSTPALAALCEITGELACDRVEGICKDRANAGDPCNGDGCKAGLVCSAGICSPKVGVGDACADNAGCAALLRCDTTTKKCVDRLRPSTACANDSDCSIGVCDAASRTCLKNAIATTKTCSGR